MKLNEAKPVYWVVSEQHGESEVHGFQTWRDLKADFFNMALTNSTPVDFGLIDCQDFAFTGEQMAELMIAFKRGIRHWSHHL